MTLEPMITAAANRHPVWVWNNTANKWEPARLVYWPKPGSGRRARVEYPSGNRRTVPCDHITLTTEAA